MGDTTPEKKKISYSEFCNLTGTTPHTRFYLKKIYGNELFTLTIWKTKIK